MRVHVAIKVFQDVVIVRQIFGVIGGFFEMLRLYLAEEADGVVSDLFPQLGIDFPIERARFRMPTPPQVIC